MSILKKIGFSLGFGIAGNLVLTAINIFQAGSRVPDGRTMEQIMGVDPEKATCEDIESLSRSDTMQLFYAAKAPASDSMNGEYQAKVLSGGVLGGATAYFTHHIFPKGTLTLKTHWKGKAFIPKSENTGWGYNIFTQEKSDGKTTTLRIRKMKTWVGPTTIGKDRNDSFHLDYSPFNSGVVHSMHDEIRQVNENLYICAGYMALGGGPINPGPFVLIGPASPWVGAD